MEEDASANLLDFYDRIIAGEVTPEEGIPIIDSLIAFRWEIDAVAWEMTDLKAPSRQLERLAYNFALAHSASTEVSIAVLEDPFAAGLDVQEDAILDELFKAGDGLSSAMLACRDS